MNKTLLHGRSRWLVAILLLGLTGTVAAAAASNPVALTPAAVTNEQTIDPNAAQYDAATGILSFVRFGKDTTIRQGLSLLAAVCKKNIVPASGVDGQVAISRLYNVTFEKALEAVLGNNFKYEVDGEFVRVYTNDEYKKKMEDPTRMAYKVITLHYITAQEAIKLIEPVRSGNSAAKIGQTTAALKTISGGGSSLSSSGGGDDLALNDTIVIYDYPENLKRAEAVIKEIDTKPRQVLVEATIMAARLTEGMEFGIDWNLLSGLPVTTGVIASGAGDGTPIEQFGFAAPAGGMGLTVGFAAGNVRALITALESVTDTTILANPKILAVNKQEGSLLIGRKIGYRGSTTISTGGIATQGEVQFLQTGTQLVFRPYIGENGYIRLVIYPKDSTGELDRTTQVPNETTTEVTTNVIVKDGQTLVLGGLFRDTVTKTKVQVPVLGNLPFVGVLFRGTTDRVEREEVIIMLTPHIIDEPSQTHPDKRVQDIELKREAAKDSLEAIDSARIAEEAYAKAAKCYLEGDTGKALFYLKISLLARPTYLEALRLRERIIAETDPDEFKRLDNNATEEVGKQDTEGWSRH